MTDDLLDFIMSQEHSEDELNQVLQTYQGYHESQSEPETPHRQMNAHITLPCCSNQTSKAWFCS